MAAIESIALTYTRLHQAILISLISSLRHALISIKIVFTGIKPLLGLPEKV